MLGFHIDFADVLTDQTNRNELHATQKPDGKDQGSPARRSVSTEIGDQRIDRRND